MKSTLSTILLLLLLPTCIYAQMQQVAFSPSPAWVEDIPFEPDTTKDSEYSLIRLVHDVQLNVETEEYYYRSVYQIKSIHGLNRISSYSIGFDPAINKIILHKVNVHRKKAIIDLLPSLHTDIKTIKKYVGKQDYTQSSVLEVYFDDLSVGDIVEIAYTHFGKQPDLYEKFAYNISMEADWGTRHKGFKVLFDPKRPMRYFKPPALPAPEISENKYGKIWSWEQIGGTGDEGKKSSYWTDDYTPMWLEVDKSIYVGDFSSVKDMKNYYKRHYNLQATPSAMVAKQAHQLTDSLSETADKVNSVFAYVQQNIKYLAYGYNIPSDPDTVLLQRFGDCKSMSFLTCKMLKAIDVEAYPLLVSINGMNLDLLDFPTPYNIDHCVVEFKLDGKYHYFDPTIEYQGGKATEKFHYHYRKGISLRDAVDTLVDVPKPRQGWRVVKDILLVDPISEDAKVKRVSFFEDHDADRIRNWGEKGDEEYVLDLVKDRMGWMYNSYEDTIFNQKYIDKNIEGKGNKIIVAAELEIPNIIGSSIIFGGDYIDLSYLHDELPTPDTDSLKYYALPFPYKIKYEMVVVGLDSGTVEQTSFEEKTDFLAFSKTATAIDGGVRFIFEIETFDDYFDGKHYKVYKELLENIKTQCKIRILDEDSNTEKEQSGDALDRGKSD